MSSNSFLQLGTIATLVVRKPIKNLHLSVLPPDGRVRVTAPEHMKDEAIRTLIATRLPWIKRQQTKFAGQERETRREYINGESHYYLGKRYRLELIHQNTIPCVYLKGNKKIVLQTRPGSSTKKRHEIMTEWYRGELHKTCKELITKWQNKIGIQASFYGIKRMKTRWGTCNQKAGRVWFNLELAKKSFSSIEYVIAHELIHLIEKKHNDRFVFLMNKHLPKWRSEKEDLNRFILSHEEWYF